MSKSYHGILRGNHIEWSGESPQEKSSGRALRVNVTVLENAQDSTERTDQGRYMAEALEKLASTNALGDGVDAAEWERSVRQDRMLPGRDE